MRILHIGIGTAPHPDELWMRDAALLGGLRDRGHEIRIAPLLAPAPLEEGTGLGSGVVRFGRLNAWFDERLPLWRSSPRLLRRILDWRLFVGPAGWLGLGSDSQRLGVRAEAFAALEFGEGVPEGEAVIASFAGERPDVVLLASPFLLPLAPRLRGRLDCPVVTAIAAEYEQIEALPPPERREMLDRLRRDAAAVDRFLVPGGTEARHVAGFLHLPPGRLAVVPPCVSLPDPAPAPRPGCDRELFRIGCAAPLRPENGIDVLIESAARLRKESRGKDVRLELAGRLPERRYWRELRERAAASGLGPAAQHVGELTGSLRRRWLRTLDVFCLPGRAGGDIGLGLLEGLGEGVPAVASDRGLAAALEEETEAVRLVPPEDPPRTVQALLYFLRQPATRIEAGRSAAAIVRERHNPAVAATAFEAALAPLSSRPAGSGSSLGS